MPEKRRKQLKEQQEAEFEALEQELSQETGLAVPEERVSWPFPGSRAIAEYQAEANRLDLHSEDYMTALAVFLARNGCVSRKVLAGMVAVSESDLARWMKEGDWNSLLNQKNELLAQALVVASAEFKANKLAQIHGEQLNLVHELNSHMQLVLRSKLQVAQNGEAYTKLSPHEMKCLAEALQWNVKTSRLIMGADTDDPTAKKEVDTAADMRNAIMAAWENGGNPVETTTTKTVTVSETTVTKKIPGTSAETVIIDAEVVPIEADEQQ